MFGPRLTKVFASRAHALWWSAMVLVTAYCVAADPPAKVAPAPDAGQAVAETGTVSKKAADPWDHVGEPAQPTAGKAPEDTWTSLREAAKKREELLP